MLHVVAVLEHFLHCKKNCTILAAGVPENYRKITGTLNNSNFRNSKITQEIIRFFFAVI